MKKSEMLKRAKRYLWDGHGKKRPGATAFVCIALINACGTSSEVHDLRDWIDHHLGEDSAGGARTARVWLQDTLGRSVGPSEAQQFRHAWVDSMIAYFESRGE
jgi:hypothetical protein